MKWISRTLPYAVHVLQFNESETQLQIASKQVYADIIRDDNHKFTRST